MIKIGHKLFIYLLLGLALGSCSKNEELLVVNVAKEFDIKLLETLSPENNKFDLIITTLSDHSCLNAEISFSNSFTVGKIGVQIDGIDNPQDCIPGSEPVSVALPLLLNEGSIAIDISLKNEVINSGTLEVSSEGYAIHMDTDHGIVYSQDQVKRIPNNLVWGYVGSNDQNTIESFSQIVGDIKDNSSLNNVGLVQGDYGHFIIHEDKTISGQNISEDLNGLNQFIFNNSSNSENIQSVVDTLKINYPQLKITLVTSDGVIIS